MMVKRSRKGSSVDPFQSTRLSASPSRWQKDYRRLIKRGLFTGTSNRPTSYSRRMALQRYLILGWQRSQAAHSLPNPAQRSERPPICRPSRLKARRSTAGQISGHSASRCTRCFRARGRLKATTSRHWSTRFSVLSRSHCGGSALKCLRVSKRSLEGPCRKTPLRDTRLRQNS